MVINQRIVDTNNLWRKIFKYSTIVTDGRGNIGRVGGAGIAGVQQIHDVVVSAAALINDGVPDRTWRQLYIFYKRGFTQKNIGWIVDAFVFKIGRNQYTCCFKKV